MASWNEILDKFGQMPSPYDAVRREYISRLSTYTGRNTILYYSAWLQKSLMANGSFDFGINDNDKTGFMTCIYKMDKKKVWISFCILLVETSLQQNRLSSI